MTAGRSKRHGFDFDAGGFNEAVSDITAKAN
jgi:hypothetical protein